MTFKYMRYKGILLLLTLVFPSFIGVLLINTPQVHSESPNSSLKIKATQSEDNFSISMSFPRLIWIEGQLEFEIETKIEGTFKFIFLDSEGGKYFAAIQDEVELEAGSEDFKFVVRPGLTTLPGIYKFGMVIRYVDDEGKTTQIYDKDYECILGLGYLFLFSIMIIFGTAIIVILTSEEDTEGLPSSSASFSGNIPDDKIRCAECGKLIDEGLTFCPECGERIPEFLRFSPSSSNS